MNKEKLEDYKVTASIHTLQIRTKDEVCQDIAPEFARCVTATRKIKDEYTSIIINPNKLFAEDLYTFGEFEIALNMILDELEVKNYIISRVDLKLDSFESDHYRRFAKLNRLLISAMAVLYATDNNYLTHGLFSQRQLSVAIKNSYFELENYDKVTESRGKDRAKSRFEERSLRLKDNDIKKEFTVNWFERWDKALNQLDLVYSTYNSHLETVYFEDKDVFPVCFRDVTDFLLQYRNCIYCKKQMVDLLDRFPEVKNARIKAKNHKNRYGIEYFSEKDVKAAVDEIKRATLEFFER